MKQYDAIIIGFGKGGKTLLSWPKEMKRWLLLSVPMRCMEVPASILDAFLQKHWFIRQSWLR